MVTDCFADGEPFPQVTWFKNDKELRDSEDPNISFHRNSIIIFKTCNLTGQGILPTSVRLRVMS